MPEGLLGAPVGARRHGSCRPSGARGATGVLSYLTVADGVVESRSPDLSLVGVAAGSGGSTTYQVSSTGNTTACGLTASIYNPNGIYLPNTELEAQVGRLAGNGRILVNTHWNNGTNVGFSLIVACPGGAVRASR